MRRWCPVLRRTGALGRLDAGGRGLGRGWRLHFRGGELLLTVSARCAEPSTSKILNNNNNNGIHERCTKSREEFRGRRFAMPRHMGQGCARGGRQGGGGGAGGAEGPGPLAYACGQQGRAQGMWKGGSRRDVTFRRASLCS